MPVEIPKDTWPGSVETVTLGATADDGGTRAATVTIGGETSLPFMHFEGEVAHRPVIALEIMSSRPDWSPVLLEAWGDVVDDPARWAAAEREWLCMPCTLPRSSWHVVAASITADTMSFRSGPSAGAPSRSAAR